MHKPEAAADVFQSQSNITLIQLIKIRLNNAPAIMVDAQVELIGMYVLSEVDKTGAAVLEDIVDEFLHDPENNQFFFGFQPFFILMKTAAGIDGPGTTDFLKKVINSRLQAKILKRWRHQAMADIADQLDGIIDDLPGLEDGLKLRGFVLVHQVLVQVQTGGGEQRDRHHRAGRRPGAVFLLPAT